MTHLCVHARGNTSTRIHGESIDIRAESELLECTSGNRVNSYPPYERSSPNLATHPSSFIFRFLVSSSSSSLFFFSFILPLKSLRYWNNDIYTRFLSNSCQLRLSLFLIFVLLDKLFGYSFFFFLYSEYK